jgi:hypothetical protein
MVAVCCSLQRDQFDEYIADREQCECSELGALVREAGAVRPVRHTPIGSVTKSMGMKVNRHSSTRLPSRLMGEGTSESLPRSTRSRGRLRQILW